MNATQIENAIAQYYSWRVNLIVPNVAWGLFLHECDLLVCTPAGYLHEVEIKISKADLIADKKKGHQHLSKKIKALWFAMPAEIEPHIEHVPVRAGIYLVKDSGRVVVARKAEISREAPACTAEERFKIANLGCMRQWTLRQTIDGLKRELNSLKTKE